jgi:hypothetical protein
MTLRPGPGRGTGDLHRDVVGPKLYLAWVCSTAAGRTGDSADRSAHGAALHPAQPLGREYQHPGRGEGEDWLDGCPVRQAPLTPTASTTSLLHTGQPTARNDSTPPVAACPCSPGQRYPRAHRWRVARPQGQRSAPRPGSSTKSRGHPVVERGWITPVGIPITTAASAAPATAAPSAGWSNRGAQRGPKVPCRTAYSTYPGGVYDGTVAGDGMRRSR